MRVRLDPLLEHLVATGLMSGEEIAGLVEGLPANDQSLDGEQLIQVLVRQKRLTPYQAGEIASGRIQSLILGNYIVLDKLGQGGMGEVFKAEHRRMERVVALKILSPKLVQTPEAVQRFQREVKAAARLTHPNIVVAYDADESNGTHYLVMEYVQGADLSTVVRQRGALPLDQALDCIFQAAGGLQYAHERGVVHRDIKPANLLLAWGAKSPCSKGCIKILDMGLARFATDDSGWDGLTGSGQIMGTVDYMAPEQAISSRDADERADVYSLGATLWYLLTGQPLYAGETIVERLMAHQNRPIPSLHQACPEASQELDGVFRQMVAKTPEARYQTMAEVIADLGPYCRGAAPGHVAFPSSLPIADVERTLDIATPQVATDPNSQHLPFDQTLTASGPAGTGTTDPTTRLPSRWGRRRLAAIGAGGVLLVTFAVWMIVRDRGGREVARFRVPDGGSVALEADRNAVGPRTDGGHDVRDPPPRKGAVAPKRAASPSTKESGVSEAPTALQLTMQPPTLEQWLKGRELLTVAQDGRAKYRKIQEAVDALRPGQAVEVLDRGPYFESLRIIEPPPDTGLFSGKQTVVVATTPFGNSTSPGRMGMSIAGARGFRLSGFDLRNGVAAEKPRVPTQVLLECTANADVLLVEDCAIHNDPSEDDGTGTGLNHAISLVSAVSPQGTVWLRRCAVLGRTDTWTTAGGRCVLQENWLTSRMGHALGVYGDSGITEAWRNVMHGSQGVTLAGSQAGATVLCQNTVTSSLNSLDWERPCPVDIRLNVFNAARGRKYKLEPLAVEPSRSWILHRNAVAVLNGSADELPLAETEFTYSARFLSISPTDRDYLRTPYEKSLAGDDVDQHLGAFPPGPAPPQGDWFTELVARWRDVLGSPSPSQ